MMQSWISEPLVIGVKPHRVRRVDLEFHGVRRDEGSFVVLIFLNDPEVPANAGRDHQSFAAAFSVFAHTRCWGDEGHCDWHIAPPSVFDQRPEHHLTPIDVTVDITDAALRLPSLSKIVVTTHATRRQEPTVGRGVLRFGALTAVAYQ
jgi:hypothetical protein